MTATTPLNLKQVARALDVHYMTAYRYVRQGHLAATRDGNVWMVTVEDLDRFVADRSGATDDVARGGDRGREVRLARLLARGDEPGAWRELDRALASGATAATCLTTLLPAALARASGAEESPGSLAAGWVATATTTRLVDRLGARHARPGRSRGAVLFAAPSGEQHRLPIATVAALARTAGFSAVDLGADVPPGVVAAAADHLGELVAVGIGLTTVRAAGAAAATVAALHARLPGLPVVLGGQGVRSPEVAESMGSRHWAPDGAAMITLLEHLAGRRAAAR